MGAGLLRRAGREVRRVLPSADSRVFVITSPNVHRHWGEALEKSLRDARLPYEVLEMHDGEPAKRLHTVEQLAEVWWMPRLIASHCWLPLAAALWAIAPDFLPQFLCAESR